MLGVVLCIFMFVFNNVILLYIINFVNKGYKKVFFDDVYFLKGLNVIKG